MSSPGIRVNNQPKLSFFPKADFLCLGWTQGEHLGACYPSLLSKQASQAMERSQPPCSTELNTTHSHRIYTGHKGKRKQKRHRILDFYSSYIRKLLLAEMGQIIFLE